MEIVETRVVTAKAPGEIWHVDLTTVPTAAGFWVPWLPFTWPQSWPFCWWVAVVVDHFSRAVAGIAVFFRSPTSVEIQRSLGLAIRRAGHPPKYVISDQGGSSAARASGAGVGATASVPALAPSANTAASRSSSGSCAR
jgi:hypothetical protein